MLTIEEKIYFPEQRQILQEASEGFFADIHEWIRPTNPVTKHHEFRLLPECVEKFLGWILYSSTINSQGGPYHGRQYKEQIRNIGSQLVSVSDRDHLDFEFKVVSSNVMNAWCLPGGKIAINKGLIEAMQNETDDFGLGEISIEDKIAAVLSHEIVHACARHSGRMMEFRLFLSALLTSIKVALLSMSDEDREEKETYQILAGAIAKVIDFLNDIIMHVSTMHCSRSHELEADRYGMLYMKRAGFDPKAAVWLQKFFEKEHPDFGISFVDSIVEIFSSHPRSSERARANEETLVELQSLSR